MWEISEGCIEFLYDVKLVSLEDLEFWEPKVSKCRKLSMQTLFSFLMLGDALGLSDTNCNQKKKINFNF